MSTLGRYGPPVALMALIFFFSAQPDLNSGLGVWDLIGRKIVHASEYALLFCLWWRAGGARRPPRGAALPVGLSVTPEVHHTLLPRGDGAPPPGLIHAPGGAAGVGGGGPAGPRGPA